jgi:hypothetical protein
MLPLKITDEGTAELVSIWSDTDVKLGEFHRGLSLIDLDYLAKLSEELHSLPFLLLVRIGAYPEPVVQPEEIVLVLALRDQRIREREQLAET